MQRDRLPSGAGAPRLGGLLVFAVWIVVSRCLVTGGRVYRLLLEPEQILVKRWRLSSN